MKKKLRVAITGGIGSGKSLVTDFVKKLGYPVIKADDLAKELMQNDESVKKKIIKAFGSESYKDSNLNTRYLAEHVFSNPEKVKKINAIVHPPTVRETEELYKQLFETNDIVFVESALVFEAKIQMLFDYIILVYSEEANRIARVKITDNISEIDIRRRMKFQIPDEKKTDRAHFVIDNNSTVQDLESRTNFVISVLRTMLEK